MERSFSGQAKVEMCRVKLSRDCCAAAEIYGALMFASEFSQDEIRVVTENDRFAERLTGNLRRQFKIELMSERAGRSGKLILSCTDHDAIERLLESYGYDARHLSLRLNAAMLEEEHCREAFLRGAFLSGGSVSDPAKNYHLELVTRHYSLANELMALLLDMEMQPKSTVRKSNYLIYFKESEAVADFLALCGAPSAAIRVHEQRVEKDVSNRVNRQLNCDNANLNKLLDAAQRQIAAIRVIREKGGWEHLDDKLKATALLREENPELNLAELAQLMGGGVSRSGVNHRLNRLVELAEDYESR